MYCIVNYVPSLFYISVSTRIKQFLMYLTLIDTLGVCVQELEGGFLINMKFVGQVIQPHFCGIYMAQWSKIIVRKHFIHFPFFEQVVHLLCHILGLFISDLLYTQVFNYENLRSQWIISKKVRSQWMISRSGYQLQCS